MRGNRASRRLIRSAANVPRKATVSRSASSTFPATFQLSFSKVTQKSVAQRRPSTARAQVTRGGRAAARASYKHERGRREGEADQQVDHVVVARVDDGQRLGERVERREADHDPALPALPAPGERRDEEEDEERVAAVERRNRGVRVPRDKARERPVLAALGGARDRTGTALRDGREQLRVIIPRPCAATAAQPGRRGT